MASTTHNGTQEGLNINSFKNPQVLITNMEH